MNEEEIINGIRRNEHGIYSYLISEYSKLLWVVAAGILNGVGTKEDIEDCVAESFAKLWENPEKFDQTRGSVKTYLCLIVKSKAMDQVRKINRVKTLPIDEAKNTEFDELEETLIRKQKIQEIYEFAKRLKSLDSEIFIMRYFYQLKPSEIAEKMCITVKEVSNRLYNSKKNLLKQIKL